MTILRLQNEKEFFSLVVSFLRCRMDILHGSKSVINNPFKPDLELSFLGMEDHRHEIELLLSEIKMVNFTRPL